MPAAVLAAWMARTGASVGEAMTALLPLAASFGRPAVSGFRVGAVAVGGGASGVGHAYLGANAEWLGLPLDTCVHAERAAVNGAWLAGERGIHAVAVDASPCGFCRQFLLEVAPAQELPRIYVAPAEGADGPPADHDLRALLPEPFGPEALGVSERLFGSPARALSCSESDPLTDAAVEAARWSYAPYSGVPAGVALRDGAGRIFPGRYAESAAFSPSLSPLESALSRMLMGLDPGAEPDVREAVLAEADGPVSQREHVRTVLSVVAPRAELREVRVRG